MLGEPALHGSIRRLAKHGITEIAVVVGYRAENVRQETGEELFGARITYIDATNYAHTGTAASLREALSFMISDVVVLEGDVLFEDRLLSRLLAAPARQNVAAVAQFVPPLSGTVVEMDTACHILSLLRGAKSGELPDRFKTVNLYRLSQAFIYERLGHALDQSICIDPQTYLEDVLDKLVTADSSILQGIDCTDCRWAEVDDQADLDHARRIFGFESEAREPC
jgi:choline kinase